MSRGFSIITSITSCTTKSIDHAGLRNFCDWIFSWEKGRKFGGSELPCIGQISVNFQKKLEDTVRRYCKDGIKLRIVFTTTKLSSFFSTKDSVTEVMKSGVVYKFCCASCNACYIGETSRHLATRIKEHLKTDKQSHVYKHVNASPQCKELCEDSCFSILDSANTKYGLRLKEGLHIGWEQPALNKQVKCLSSSIVV